MKIKMVGNGDTNWWKQDGESGKIMLLTIRNPLMNYLLDGRCEISNNGWERKAKAYATGRKNFLFYESVDGAKLTAIVTSLIETAKANKLNPFKYRYTPLLYMPDYKNESVGIEQLMLWSGIRTGKMFWNHQKSMGTFRFRVLWLVYTCCYKSLTIILTNRERWIKGMKLHLGCGDKYLELENGDKYKHVDIRDGKHIDFVTDVKDLSMFEDNSIEEIYACHLLEHIKRNEEIAVLKEWNRVLMGGGVLRIAVPNFSAIVQEYQKNNNLSQLMGLLYGGQNYDYNFHYQTFDRKILEEKLRRVGFVDIEEYDWRDFLPKDYDDFSRAYLPHMDFEHGRLMSLNLIARKG